MSLSRAIGKMVLQKLAPEGLPITRMVGIARSLGGGYRYQDMLNDARSATHAIKYQGNIERLSPGTRVPSAWMVETELSRDRRYRVYGRAWYHNPETGVDEWNYVSMYSDSYLDEAGYESEFIENHPFVGPDSRYQVKRFQRIGVEHNKGWEY